MPLVPCPACSHSVSDLAPFCPQCGHPLRPAPAEVAPPTSTAVPAPEPPAAPQTSPTLEPEPEPEPNAYRCICGTWNREGDAQCASCRRPLGQSSVRRPRPVQNVHTGPVDHPIPRRDYVREQMDRDEEAGNTLGWIAVICGVLSLLIFPVPLGVVAIACGIPAYLRGARHGLVGMFIGLLGILLILWAYR